MPYYLTKPMIIKVPWNLGQLKTVYQGNLLRGSVNMSLAARSVVQGPKQSLALTSVTVFLYKLCFTERGHKLKLTFKNFSSTFASNGSLIEWKIALFHKKNCQINIHSKSGDQKMPICNLQSQFSMSKIIRIFLNFFHRINLGACFFVVDIFWQLQF